MPGGATLPPVREGRLPACRGAAVHGGGGSSRCASRAAALGARDSRSRRAAGGRRRAEGAGGSAEPGGRAQRAGQDVAPGRPGHREQENGNRAGAGGWAGGAGRRFPPTRGLRGQGGDDVTGEHEVTGPSDVRLFTPLFFFICPMIAGRGCCPHRTQRCRRLFLALCSRVEGSTGTSRCPFPWPLAPLFGSLRIR